VPRIDQMIGNLFYRGTQPSEIERMSYMDLVYYNEWHKIMVKTEKGN
jgi:hypothetical protein